MRLVKINAPEGQGAVIARMALDMVIPNATVYSVQAYSIEKGQYTEDVIEVKTSTPEAKDFVEKLMTAPFFSPKEYSIAVRYPRSIVSAEKIRRVTLPFVIPPIDIYEELWEFSHITFSFIGRAIAAATVIIIIAGAVCALLTHPPLQYEEFSSILTGFLIAIVIGIAAGLASADNTGKREMIGLTISAQTVIFAAWFGISLVFGFPEVSKTIEHIASFFVNIMTITITASATFYLMQVKGEAIRNYVDILKK